MVFLHEPQWPAGFSSQSQQWGCVAARLQTLAGFPFPSNPSHQPAVNLLWQAGHLAGGRRNPAHYN